MNVQFDCFILKKFYNMGQRGRDFIFCLFWGRDVKKVERS